MVVTGRLAGRVALVTGGASGIGAATCAALAAGGARVLVADVDGAGAQAVAEQVDGVAVSADVRRLADLQAAVAAAEEHFGGLDWAVLNAGVLGGCGVEEDFAIDRFERAVDVNVGGVVLGTHAVLPALRRRGGGAIVATASIAGLAGQPADPIYAATKHAVVGFVRSVGPLLAGEGIRCNAVCPAYADTPMLDALRDTFAASGAAAIPPGDVAATIVGLLDGEQAGECWFVQPGRPAGAFRFRGVPGPRATSA